LKQISKEEMLIERTYLQARGTTTTKESLTAAAAREWERSRQALIYKGVSGNCVGNIW